MRLNEEKQGFTKFSGELNDERFERLFRQYLPLVRRVWQRYFVPGLELADWEQEARLVLIRVVRAYRGSSVGQFSGFYKQSLVNRILDLYRARQAHKRIPAGCLASLTNDYAELLLDPRQAKPDDIIYCKYCIQELLKNCSEFERTVLVSYQAGYSVNELALQFNCSKRKIQSAMSRSRAKLIRILEH